MAQHEIEAGILISAPPSRVWQVLTDFSAFPAWNPFIRSISGPLREGARLTVQIMPPGRSSMHFRPTVLVSRPNEELRWRGSLLIPGLFSGEHSVLLRPEGVNSTQSFRARGSRACSSARSCAGACSMPLGRVSTP